MRTEDQQVLGELQQRFDILLPAEYRDRYEDMQPMPMGSAGVRYGADGKIAWDQMWGSFCDLALAGGPPHRGTLLEPARLQEIAENRPAHAAMVAEICRGLGMVTDLDPAESPDPGWIRMTCSTSGMAGWMLRAITIENIAVRADGRILEVPAGPTYRLLKEVRNVVTAVAKTTHYWAGHMPVLQRQEIAGLLGAMNDESPLLSPRYVDDDQGRPARAELAEIAAMGIRRETGLERSPHRYADWLGIECGSVRSAVWMMRMLVAANILARREATVLFVPLNTVVDPDGALLVDSVALIHRLSGAFHRATET